MNAARKNESRMGVRLIVKTLSKVATDFIAATARYASANTEFCIMFLVLALQFVTIVWGAL